MKFTIYFSKRTAYMA